MPLSALLAPIASATIVNVFLFALMWRGDRLEARTGNLPWYYVLGIVVYAGVVLAAFLSAKNATAASGPVLFAFAAGAEAFGVVIAWSLHGAFIGSRGMPKKDRAVAIAFSLILAGGMFAGVFAR